MTPEEAANVIAQVCAKWEGTISDGDTIREAYRTLTTAAGVDMAAATAAAAAEQKADEPPAKPTPPNRQARRAKGPTKKAARSRA